MNSTAERADVPVVLLYNIDETWAAPEIAEALTEAQLLATGLGTVGHPVQPVPIYNTDLGTPLAPYDPRKWVVLNWCEGLPGLHNSYGLVAQTLDSLQYAYTGSPAAILDLSMDKPCVKQLLEEQQVPIPMWRLYDSAQPDGWTRFPAIVKPAYEHCSFGVTADAVVTNLADLRRRIAYVRDTFQQPALVEDFVDGREFHVSLWGNGVIEMLPPAEMDFSAFAEAHNRLCTYEAKFDPTSIHYNKIQTLIPAPLTPAENHLLEQTAAAAYRVVGCRDYARMDIRLRDGIFYVLDVNPNADISSEGSMAYAAQVAGYSFGAMGSRLVNLAALRHPVWSRPTTPLQ